MAASPPAPAKPAPLAPTEPGQLVFYWETAEEAQKALSDLARFAKLQPAQQTRLEHLGGIIATFQLRSQAEAESLRSLIKKNYASWRVDFNTRYVAEAGPRLYGTKQIGLAEDQAGASPADGVRIGIVDTEVLQPAALARAKIARRNFLAANEKAATPAHGTAVATLIGGAADNNGFRSTAPGATLLSAAVMQGEGQHTYANTFAIVQALDWLAGEKVRVINLSFGGPGDSILERAFAQLTRKPVILVAAAGNSGADAPPVYPAAYPGVIAVTATDAADHIYAMANRGGYVTIAAPGVDVWVPDDQGGRYVSGTSFATPFVSGVIARMARQAPNDNPVAVREKLCRNARDLGAPGNDPVFGCGLLQAGFLAATRRLSANSQ